MARENIPFLAIGNRGLLSPKSLARVDLDRTRLSAEVFNNFIGATQGSLSIRPGTKWMGSSLNDSGAEFLEFVASTDDVALCELTHQKMRIWLGDDAHELALLSRPAVSTTLTLSDTGWDNASTGGNGSSVTSNLIPLMTGATTGGVTITASSQNIVAVSPELEEGVFSGGDSVGAVWKAADRNNNTYWADTGPGSTTIPSWLNVDFGSGGAQSVGSYSMRAASEARQLNNMPRNWELIGSNFDTGTFAADTGKWILEDSQTSQTGWAVSERRTYTLTDTGTPGPWRHWRLYVTALNGDEELHLAEFELLGVASATDQALFSNGQLILNATSVGALAKATKRVILSDTGTEHSLAVHVSRGPVTLRVGSTSGDDDYISETAIGTGYHNLAFTPVDDFYITVQSDALVNRIVNTMTIGDSGTVEIAAPWTANDLDNVRYDQSADVVYVDCDGVRPQKIERRGAGRSWSVVNYEPNDGPFLPAPSSSAKLQPGSTYGNATLNSSIPFFSAGHAGALVRIFHEGQSGVWPLGAVDATTDVIGVSGISDTGAESGNQRRIVVSVSGAGSFSTLVERSIDAEDRGFRGYDTGTAGDTGTHSKTIDDPDDNIKAYYRVRVTSYTSGVAVVTITYQGGGVTGIGRVTGYNSNTSVDIEVLSRFSDTGASANWQQGYWSTERGFPTAVAFHGGRLAHAGGANLFLSASDDYESFDETIEGDAAPIIRTLGSGPVDSIKYLVSVLRLVIGTAGQELAVRSSSLDEPLTPDNSSTSPFSTQGSANLRAVKLDTRAIMVQRSRKRLFMIGPAENTLADYEGFDLTLLVPDLLASGAVSIAVQRQPDTRIHVVREDGTVAILTYEPQEEVICWSTWSTDGFVERAACLPGLVEDAVFYHIRRTINGVTKRYLEKWAQQSECVGDTGLTWLCDCAASFSDTGRSATLTGFSHLAGEQVAVWSDDTGSIPGVDRSPGWGDEQTLYTVDTGAGTITLGTAVHHAVAGLVFRSRWRSSKLAFGAEMTALAQQKITPQVALILYQCHNDGIRFGSDSGHTDPLPRMIGGAVVDADAIHSTLDMVAVPMPTTWDPDARFELHASSPRPVTTLAAVVTVVTSEK